MNKIVKNNSPIFIGGQMKSGTTLVRALLSQHPNIFGGLETHWFDVPSKVDINDQHIVKLINFYEISHDEIESIISNHKNSNLHFIDIFLSKLTNLNNKTRWVEKTPQNIKNIRKIINIWKKFNFIHVTRDYRDIFASWKLSGKNDLGFYIDTVMKSYDELSLLQNNDNYYEISYEKLVTDTEKSMKKLLDFLNEDYSNDCYEINTQNSKNEFLKVKNITGKESNTLKSTQQSVSRAKIGHYKHVLTKSEIEQIENKLEPYIKKFNYEVINS